MKAADFLITLALGAAIFNIALPEGTLMSAPLAAQEQQAGNITYITGGIGDSEAETMRGIAKDYPLEIAFIQKLKEYEEFIASVKVQIQDLHKNVLLDVVTEDVYKRQILDLWISTVRWLIPSLRAMSLLGWP